MRRHLKRLLLVALAGLVATIVWVRAVPWLDHGRFEVATDNAYVRADVTSIAPRVSGYIVSANVTDNATIEVGDELFRIDDRDYRARLASADAAVASAEAALVNLDAETGLQRAVIAQSEAQLRSSEAARTFARRSLGRYRSLVGKSTISQAQLEEAEAAGAQADAAFGAAAAALRAQRRKLDVLAAQRQAAQAVLSQAEAARDLALIDLENTVVKAPLSGIVGNRQARVGRFVTTGASVVDIVPVRDVWVVANLKETQLEYVRVGQPVRITVDGFAHDDIRGVVDSLAPGSGAAFSLIPADNATGNFVRVVQRVPVKIRLTRVPPHARLVPGLSARVAIRTAPQAPS